MPACPVCGGNVTPVNPQISHYYCEVCQINLDARDFDDEDEDTDLTTIHSPI